MNRKRILPIVIVLALLGAAYYFYGGSSTPKGQPRLVSFSSSDLAPVKEAFNDSASSVRVLVLLSPT